MIRGANQAGISEEEIARICALPLERVRDILETEEPEEAPAVPLGAAGCAYCYGTRVVTSARACRCQQHDFSGSHEDGCDGGWIYVNDFCRCAGAGE